MSIMDSGQIQVTKMDATHRQIRAAIRMWFAEEDPVAIHTLVAAAHEVVHSLFKLRGLSGLLFDSRLVKDEYRSEVAKLLKAPANFFKHADRDPDAIMDFHPYANELLLLTCVHALARMGEPTFLEYDVLTCWFRIHQPKFFPTDAIRDHTPAEALEHAERMTRNEFFKNCRALWDIGRMPSQIAARDRE